MESPCVRGRLVEQPPYKKVLIGRGATNSKGPQMVQLNALTSIKAVTGKLPVNIIFVAEGDEERMSMGLRTFMSQHSDLFKAAAVYRFGGQGGLGGGSRRACFYVELTTSGAKWGQGPNYSDIHGGNKRTVASPAWRHIKMLSTLIDEDTNKVLIDGFYDNIEPLSRRRRPSCARRREARSEETRDEPRRREVHHQRSVRLHKRSRYGQSMNLDGIWGGNMFAGGSGSILPNKVTSKHSFRYVPNMSSADILAKLRKHLDKHGYKDVEINVIGDQPWAKVPTDTDIGRAAVRMFDAFQHCAWRSRPPIDHLQWRTPCCRRPGRPMCSSMTS